MFGLFRLYWRGFTGGKPYVPAVGTISGQTDMKVGLPSVPAGGVHVGF